MPLKYDTVSRPLLDYLIRLMSNNVFRDFYLVGGTSLSLQRGHRMSIDIDLFTDIDYGNLNVPEIKTALHSMFAVTDNIEHLQTRQIVNTIYVGDDKDSIVKLDLCYDDGRPAFPIIETDGLRIADERDIAAMKLEAIANGSFRRKDFWDIHDLLESYSINDLIEFHKLKYPYGHSVSDIIEALRRCDKSQDATDIICLKGKYWEFIAEDLKEEVKQISHITGTE